MGELQKNLVLVINAFNCIPILKTTSVFCPTNFIKYFQLSKQHIELFQIQIKKYLKHFSLK